MILPKDSIEDILNIATGYQGQLVFTDSTYFVPSLEWLTNDLPAALKRFFDTPGKTEANDCDDFAVGAWYAARKANMQRRDANEGIAFGVATVQIPEGVTLNGIQGPCTHETNIAVAKDESGQAQAYFFEPQTGLAVLVAATDAFTLSVRM